jgi:hypothetical protein
MLIDGSMTYEIVLDTVLGISIGISISNGNGNAGASADATAKMSDAIQ